METGKTAGLHLLAPIVERNDWNEWLLGGLVRWSGEQATSRQICRIDKSESLLGDLEQLVWVEWLIQTGIPHPRQMKKFVGGHGEVFSQIDRQSENR